MVDLVALVPDLLRLAAVPAFGWAAWRDHLTRRVPSRLWWPLAGLGVLLLVWDGLVAFGQPPPAGRFFLIRAGFSIGFLLPLAVAFYRFHLVGGADAKAFIALAVLFPTYPTYDLGPVVLPVMQPPLGVFSLTVLTNAALLGLLYPVVLAVGNLLSGEWSPAMVRARRVHWTALPETHGRLAEVPEGRTLRGLDLDALRMYLRWRGVSLVDLRERPGELQDPVTVPDEPNDPTDGRLDPTERLSPDQAIDRSDWDPSVEVVDAADSWAAEAFLRDVGSAYGTSPAQLRAGLELLARAENVWVSPGLPYLVPVVAGLLVGLGFGDLLYAVMLGLGLA